MTYSVRPMVKDDIDQVTEIDREAFPSQWPPANYRQEMQNKIAYYIVACDDNRTAGSPAVPPQPKFNLVSWLMPWRKKKRPLDISTPVPHQYIVGFSGIWLMVDEAHVTNIAVRREYQGQGLGELLLLASVDLAGELKASFLTLEVRASNIVAQSLYRKYGFAHMGIRRGYYLDNREDAIIMSTDSINSETFQEQIRQLREALAKKLSYRIQDRIKPPDTSKQ